MTRQELYNLNRIALVGVDGSYGTGWIWFVRDYTEHEDGYRPWSEHDPGHEASDYMVLNWGT